MSKKFWKLTNEVEASGSELYIEGPISDETWWGDEATPKQLRDELKKIASKNLTVIINSPGGDVWAGVAMYNALRELDAEVTVRVDGIAASIASVIAMAGDKIIMSPGSMMMVHRASTLAWGNKEEMAKVIEMLETVDDSIKGIYVDRTGLSADEVSDIMDAETWMTAEKAVELGFADSLGKTQANEEEEPQAAFSGNFAFSMKASKASIDSLVGKVKAESEAEAEPGDPAPDEVEKPVTPEPNDPTASKAEPTKDDEQVDKPSEEKPTNSTKEKEVEMSKKDDIATDQVIAPQAKAPVESAPVVNAKEWFKSKEAVEAFTMALANNPGKSFEDKEVQDAYKAAQVQAGIEDPTIFTLPEPVITSIEDAVTSGEIYRRLNHTGLDVYKLVWDDTDANTDTSRAGGFNPTWEDGESNVDRTKEQQILDFEKRVIRAQYIYKYLVLGKETIRENRSTGALVRFVLNELPVRVVRELERAAIIGDGRANNAKRKITSFTSVKADATAGNVFAETYTRQADESLAEAVRRARDLIEADGEVVLIAKKGFATDAMFEKDGDGKLLFPIGTSAEAIFGVSTIIEPTWLNDTTDTDNDAYLVVLGQYYTVGDNSVEAFTNFKLETNENEFLQEIYKGGALAARASAVAISASVES